MTGRWTRWMDKEEPVNGPGAGHWAESGEWSSVRWMDEVIGRWAKGLKRRQVQTDERGRTSDLTGTWTGEWTNEWMS